MTNIKEKGLKPFLHRKKVYRVRFIGETLVSLEDSEKNIHLISPKKFYSIYPQMKPSEIDIIDITDMIFRHGDKEYYVILSGSEIKKEIAVDMGSVEDEYIDCSVYEGSPYKSRRRRATADDVETEHIINWLIRNRNQWKEMES